MFLDRVHGMDFSARVKRGPDRQCAHTGADVEDHVARSDVDRLGEQPRGCVGNEQAIRNGVQLERMPSELQLLEDCTDYHNVSPGNDPADPSVESLAVVSF